MDRETKYILNRISSKIPARLARNTSKVVYDTTEEQKARLALKSNSLSKSKKNQLSRLLDSGAFRRREEVVNEETVNALDRFHEREVAKARASGRLKDPMTDPFYARRLKRSRRIAQGLETPTKQKPYTQAEIDKARQHLKPTIERK